MQSQHLFEAPFISASGTETCSKDIRAGKCLCSRCQGKTLLSPSLSNGTQWLFEAPHSSIFNPEKYMDAMVLPFRSRPLSPTNIAQLTTQIEARMKALGIPAKYIGIKGIPGTNGRGFDPNMTDPGGFVRTRGMAVGFGVLKNMPSWGAWNKASLSTRIDAVIAHEWVRLNKGTGHQKARDQAPNTLLPISDAARLLLLNQKNRGTPEIAPEYGGEANEGSFRPIRSTEVLFEAEDLTRKQMADFLLTKWQQTPILHRLTPAHIKKFSDKNLFCELINILKTFQIKTGVTIQVVQAGEVQKRRGRGNLASLRSRPGFLQIENTVFQNIQKLLIEIRHELAFYYAGGSSGVPRLITNPMWNGLNLLEFMIEGNGQLPSQVT